MATAISFSRIAARQHYLSDVFAGSTMGFFIGKFVFENGRVRLDKP
jgi:membrane-associated phospholipid phosphatase